MTDQTDARAQQQRGEPTVLEQQQQAQHQTYLRLMSRDPDSVRLLDPEDPESPVVAFLGVD